MDLHEILNKNIEIIPNDHQNIENLGNGNQMPKDSTTDMINKTIGRMHAQKQGGGKSPSPPNQNRKPPIVEHQPGFNPMAGQSQQKFTQGGQSQGQRPQKQSQNQSQNWESEEDVESGVYPPNFDDEYQEGPKIMWKILLAILIIGIITLGILVRSKINANKMYSNTKKLGGKSVVVNMSNPDGISNADVGTNLNDTTLSGDANSSVDVENVYSQGLMEPSDKIKISKSKIKTEIVPYKKWLKDTGNVYMGYIEVESFEFAEYLLIQVTPEDFKELKKAGVVKVDFHIVTHDKKDKIAYAELNPAWRDLE